MLSNEGSINILLTHMYYVICSCILTMQVGGFGFELSNNTAAISENVEVLNNNIADIRCFTNEVPATVVDVEDSETGETKQVVMNDARGAVLQLYSTLNEEYLASANEVYTGNVITNAQIMAANAIIDGTLPEDDMLQTGVNTIGTTIIDWAKGAKVKGKSPTLVPFFRCNGDSMHHVIK